MERIRPYIFLVDGVGALVSLCITAFVLPRFTSALGLPREALLMLALPAAGLATYSGSCFLLGARDARWVAAIASGNLGYCVFVVYVMAWFVDVVTPAGVAYFAGEIGVVATIAAIEARLARTQTGTQPRTASATS